MIVVVPISHTQVNWDVFKKVTYDRFGRNIRASIDSSKNVPNNMAEFIGALAEFRESQTDFVDILRNAGSLLEHVSISMLCKIPDPFLMPLIIEMRLLVVKPKDPAEDLIVVSGNLSLWRTAIINLGAPFQGREYHNACTQFLQAFDSLGLSRIFENYSRKSNTRGDTILILK